MTIVFKVSDNIKEMMIKHYEDMKCEKTPPYAIFQVKDYDCVTTLYESGKVMFQGLGADIEASFWTEQERILNNRKIDISEKKDKKEPDKDKSKQMLFMSTIGSDEVGTGDYFGPIVVTASYVSKENFGLLEDLGVKDSKIVTDDKILKIAPDIIKRIPHCTFILDNKKYNEYYSADFNMNKIKAVLHNKVLVGLLKKDNYDYEKIVIDQFVYPKKYYEHINEAQTKVTNITFETKAESKYMSVAASSIISRYIFLQEMDKLSKKYNITLPLGAGDGVDKVGRELVNVHGIKILDEVSKKNFKNTEKITAK